MVPPKFILKDLEDYNPSRTSSSKGGQILSAHVSSLKTFPFHYYVNLTSRPIYLQLELVYNNCMIVIYTSPGCASCRKAKNYMKENRLPFVEKNIFNVMLNDEEIRPLTDQVTVQAPTVVPFDVDITYFISNRNRATAAAIQANVAAAVEEYILWQQSHIGLDIVPDRLIQLCREAGAKRIMVRSPAFQVVGDDGVARLRNQSISYGGLEDA